MKEVAWHSKDWSKGCAPGLLEFFYVLLLQIPCSSEGNGKDNVAFVKCVCSVERVKGEKSSLERNIIQDGHISIRFDFLFSMFTSEPPKMTLV